MDMAKTLADMNDFQRKQLLNFQRETYRHCKDGRGHAGSSNAGIAPNLSTYRILFTLYAFTCIAAQ